jgi:hypothetical protein
MYIRIKENIFLSIVLYGYEIWSLTAREIHRHVAVKNMGWEPKGDAGSWLL